MRRNNTLAQGWLRADIDAAINELRGKPYLSSSFRAQLDQALMRLEKSEVIENSPRGHRDGVRQTERKTA